MTLDERLRLAQRLARGEEKTKKNTAAARAVAAGGGTLPSAAPSAPAALPSASQRAAAREDAFAQRTVALPVVDTHLIKTLPAQISAQRKPAPMPLSRSYADAVADKKAEASRAGFDLAGMRRRGQAMQPTAEATEQLQAQEEAASRLSSEYQDMSRRYQAGQERLFYTGLADQKERLERVRTTPDFDEKVSAAAQGSYGGLALPWDNGGARRAAAAIATGDYRVDAKLQYMTDEEREVFQYYVGAGDYAGAQEYLDTLDRYLNARQQQDFSEQQQADAEEHPIKGAVTNIASSFFNGTGYVRNAAQAVENAATGEYIPTDYNSPFFGFVHLTRDTAQGVHQAAYDAGGSAGALAADVGLSLGQMGSKLAGGSLPTLLFTGANAAEGTTLDALERGATPGQAFATGTVAGAVEILTEKLPVDNLFRIARSAPGTLREAITQILKQAGSEGTQEMISEIANNLADQAVMGDKSQYELYVQSLVAQGMERGQAEREATRQFYLENVLQAGAAGAVSGGIMGAGAQAVGRIGDYRSSAPDRAIDRAYSAMETHGPFSPEAQAANQRAVTMLPTRGESWAETLPGFRVQGAQTDAQGADGAARGTDTPTAETGPQAQKNASTGEAADYFFDASDPNNSWKDRTYTQGTKTFIQSSDRQRMYEVPQENELNFAVESDGTVVLSDDIVGKLNKDDYRDFIKAYAELNLITVVDPKTGAEINPKPVTIQDDGTRVIITQTGINDVSKKIRGAGIKNQDNVASILLLNHIIENATRLDTVENKHGGTTPFTDYTAQFSVGGREYSVLLHIKNAKQGDRYHYHTLEKIDVGPTDGSNSTKGTGTYQASPTSFDPIIPQAGEGVNPQSAQRGGGVLPGGRFNPAGRPAVVDSGVLPGDNGSNGGATDGGTGQADAGRAAGAGFISGGVHGENVRGEAGKEGLDTGVYGESPSAAGTVQGAQAGGVRTGHGVPAWVQGHIVEDTVNPGLLHARDTVRRYGADAVVVSDEALKARNPSAWALTSGGTVYISDKLPSDLVDVIGYHEVIHAARQRGDASYHAFLNQSNDNIDFFTQRTQDVLGTIIESRFPGRDFIELNDSELKTAIDELNAVIWGCYKADPENARAQFLQVFNDYDAYIAELDGIMERSRGGKDDGVGAMNNPYGYRQKVSQARSNTFERSGVFSEVERQMEGLRAQDMTYDVATERQSMDHAAQRLAVDYDGERAGLPGKDAWSGEDLDTAMGILSRETAGARESGDYAAVKEWARLIQEKGTQAGQMIQAFAKYTRTPEGVLVRAADTLEKAGVKPEIQRQVMDAVAGFSETLGAVEQGDKGALLELIKRQARQRGTPVSGATEKALGAQEFQYLYDFALAQLDNIALDYERVSTGQKISTYQAFSHLFNLKTALRNMVSNQVFDLVDAAANDMGLIPDAIMGVFTGRRTVGLERSWLSGEKRAGALGGAQRGWAEVALDVDMGGASKYGTGGRRANKMAGALPSRIMSTAEKAMGFELNVTDEFHKGSVEAEVLASLRPLVERGDVTQEEARAWAEQEALYRAFQDDTLPGALLGQMKDAMNLIGTGDSGKRIRGRTVHTFGLGDLVQKYTQVPGALMSRAVEFSPVGYGKALWTLAQAARSGSVDAQTQRGASLAIGRATTGTGLVALFASLAAAGLLGRADDEDDRDIAALNASEGISGTQLNLSGLERWISGGDPGRQVGDVLVSLDFLEPLNALMTVGALAAQDTGEGGAAGKYMEASLEGTFNAILDTPTMQSFSTLFDTLRYHKADDETPLWLEIPVELAKGSVTGFVPGLVRQSAQAADGVYRDAYGSDSAAQQTVDTVKNSLPGLRGTLPVKLTPFGEEKTQGGGAGLRAANAFLMPGALNIYRQSEVSRELEQVRGEAGADNIYPDRNPPRTVQYGGVRYELDARERQDYQRRRGETAYDLMAGLMESRLYQGAGVEARAELLADALAFANDQAKREVLEGRGVAYKSPQWEKAYAAQRAGVDFGVYLEYREMLTDEKERGTASQANASVRQALFRDGRLDEKQKELLDGALLSDGFYIPREMDVDYSGGEGFAISQMSEGAQKRWPEARDRFGLDAEAFGRAWGIVQDDGLSVMEKKAALRELMGGYQGNALYKALTQRTQ